MTGLNVVADLSHHNGVVNLVAAKNDGILAVIHKATQGTSYTDELYAPRQAQAANAGLFWGAYHFGTGADGVAQAEYFLSAVQPAPKLLVLDFEANPQVPA